MAVGYPSYSFWPFSISLSPVFLFLLLLPFPYALAVSSFHSEGHFFFAYATVRAVHHHNLESTLSPSLFFIQLFVFIGDRHLGFDIKVRNDPQFPFVVFLAWAFSFRANFYIYSAWNGTQVISLESLLKTVFRFLRLFLWCFCLLITKRSLVLLNKYSNLF